MQNCLKGSRRTHAAWLRHTRYYGSHARVAKSLLPIFPVTSRFQLRRPAVILRLVAILATAQQPTLEIIIVSLPSQTCLLALMHCIHPISDILVGVHAALLGPSRATILGKEPSTSWYTSTFAGISRQTTIRQSARRNACYPIESPVDSHGLISNFFCRHSGFDNARTRLPWKWISTAVKLVGQHFSCNHATSAACLRL